MGDTVNLASRIEGINKVYRCSITLSEETFRLAQDVIEARELDLITVAGKTEPIRIYEAMSRAGELPPERIALRDLFAEGLAAYRRQDWDEAQNRFEGCLRHAPRMGPRSSSFSASPFCGTSRRPRTGAGSGGLRRSNAAGYWRLTYFCTRQFSVSATKISPRGLTAM